MHAREASLCQDHSCQACRKLPKGIKLQGNDASGKSVELSKHSIALDFYLRAAATRNRHEHSCKIGMVRGAIHETHENGRLSQIIAAHKNDLSASDVSRDEEESNKFYSTVHDKIARIFLVRNI